MGAPIDNGLLVDLVGDARGSLRPDGEGLRTLFRTWCATVPYDATFKLAGFLADPDALLWGLDVNELVSAALRSGAGGTCFPLASGFANTARACGFDAVVHAASSAPQYPADHAVVVVRCDGAEFLCDPAFLHLTPAQIPGRDGQRVLVGPLRSPLEVFRDDGVVVFRTQRGTSLEWHRYELGAALDDAALRSAYEVAGRYPQGLRPYVRRQVGGHQRVVDPFAVTVKGPGGVQRKELCERLWRDEVTAELGWSGDVLELICSQIEAARTEKTAKAAG